MAKKHEDPSMAKVRAMFEKSGLTLHELGVRMGCPPETARQAMHQFLRTGDPHISVLRRFAKAMEIPLGKLTGK